LQFVSQYQCTIVIFLSTMINWIYQGLTLHNGFHKSAITGWSKGHPQFCQNVTRKVNRLNELLSARKSTDTIQRVLIELNEVLEEFKITHEAYYNQIKTVREWQESEKYYNSLIQLASELEREISSRIMQPN